jgi:hypothetical protein
MMLVRLAAAPRGCTTAFRFVCAPLWPRSRIAAELEGKRQAVLIRVERLVRSDVRAGVGIIA